MKLTAKFMLITGIVLVISFLMLAFDAQAKAQAEQTIQDSPRLNLEKTVISTTSNNPPTNADRLVKAAANPL